MLTEPKGQRGSKQASNFDERNLTKGIFIPTYFQIKDSVAFQMYEGGSSSMQSSPRVMTVVLYSCKVKS